MTIEEIEQIIQGHYHPSAKQENILKMWNIIEQETYIIKQQEQPPYRYIIISNKAHRRIINEVNRAVLSLKLYNKNANHYSKIVTQKEWDDLEARRIAAENYAKKRQQKQQQQSQKNSNQPYGIYCIKYKDEVIYIGMTQTSFKDRYKEHKKLFNNPENSDMILYHSGLNFEDLEFKVMVDLTKDKADRELTTRDIKAMEMGLIACFKPRFNVSGVRIPYRFT